MAYGCTNWKYAQFHIFVITFTLLIAFFSNIDYPVFKWKVLAYVKTLSTVLTWIQLLVSEINSQMLVSDALVSVGPEYDIQVWGMWGC